MLVTEIKLTALRAEIDILLSSDNCDLEQLENLAQQYYKQMSIFQSAQASTQSGADLLQNNLDWLNSVIEKLSAIKANIGAELLKIQKGKKAKHGYSQNN